MLYKLQLIWQETRCCRKGSGSNRLYYGELESTADEEFLYKNNGSLPKQQADVALLEEIPKSGPYLTSIASAPLPDDVLKRCLNWLWTDESFKDVTFVCAGNSTVRAHAAVLACLSPFLEDILSAVFDTFDNASGSGIVLHLPEYKLEDVTLLLQMCYQMSPEGPGLSNSQADENLESLIRNLKAFEKGQQHLSHEHSPPQDVSKFSIEQRRLENMDTDWSLGSFSDDFEKDTFELEFPTDLVRNLPVIEDVKNPSSKERSSVGLKKSHSSSNKKDKSRRLPKNRAKDASCASVPNLLEAPSGQDSIKVNDKLAAEKVDSQLCPYCGDRFTDPILLKYHIYREENYTPFTCKVDSCKFGAFSALGISTHTRDVHGGGMDTCQEELINCPECKMKLQPLENHKKHYHDDTLPLKCDDCSFRDSTQRGLSMHRSRVHTEKTFKCRCGSSYSKKVMYLRHLRFLCPLVKDAKSVFSFKCSECNFCTDYKKALASHMVKEHLKQIINCRCGAMFRSMVSYRRHVKLRCDVFEDKDRMLQENLEQCGKCPKRVLDLNDHYAKMHNENLPFSCSTCYCRFETERGLQNHVTLEHSDRAYLCDCSKAFATPASLHIHQKYSCPVNEERTILSDANKKFKCQKCDYACFAELGLRYHEAKAHNFGEHSCKCGAKFSRKRNLNAHLRKGCPLKEEIVDSWVECNECSFKAKNEHTLLVHKGRIHSKGKKFQCKCGVAYTRKHMLNTHIRRNCLLNENRENKELHHNCYKPADPKMAEMIVQNQETELEAADKSEPPKVDAALASTLTSTHESFQSTPLPIHAVPQH